MGPMFSALGRLASRRPWFVIAAWVVLTVWLLMTAIRPTKITDRSITLAGVSEEFVRAYEEAWLPDPNRLDRVEIVSIADGEVVLFWELPAKQAAKLLKQLREELISFEVEEFKRAWGLE